MKHLKPDAFANAVGAFATVSPASPEFVNAIAKVGKAAWVFNSRALADTVWTEATAAMLSWRKVA